MGLFVGYVSLTYFPQIRFWGRDRAPQQVTSLRHISLMYFPQIRFWDRYRAPQQVTSLGGKKCAPLPLHASLRARAAGTRNCRERVRAGLVAWRISCRRNSNSIGGRKPGLSQFESGGSYCVRDIFMGSCHFSQVVLGQGDPTRPDT